MRGCRPTSSTYPWGDRASTAREGEGTQGHGRGTGLGGVLRSFVWH